VFRLKSLGKDVKFVEYLHLPHGFLNFQTPIVAVKGAGQGNKLICTWIKEIIHENWKVKGQKKLKIKFKYS
jgi:hypothetical protein